MLGELLRLVSVAALGILEIQLSSRPLGTVVGLDNQIREVQPPALPLWLHIAPAMVSALVLWGIWAVLKRTARASVLAFVLTFLAVPLGQIIFAVSSREVSQVFPPPRGEIRNRESRLGGRGGSNGAAAVRPP